MRYPDLRDSAFYLLPGGRFVRAVKNAHYFDLREVDGFHRWTGHPSNKVYPCLGPCALPPAPIDLADTTGCPPRISDTLRQKFISTRENHLQRHPRGL